MSTSWSSGARGRGLGRALIEAGRRMARDTRCQRYTVNPEPRAIGFYQRCGILEVLFRQQELGLALVEGPPNSHYAVERIPSIPREVAASTPFRLGCFQTGFDAWVKAGWTDPAVDFPLCLEVGRIPEVGACYHLFRDFRAERCAWLGAYVPSEVPLAPVLEVCSQRALQLGYTSLNTTVPVEEIPTLGEHGGTLGEASMILGERLTGGPPG